MCASKQLKIHRCVWKWLILHLLLQSIPSIAGQNPGKNYNVKPTYAVHPIASKDLAFTEEQVVATLKELLYSSSGLETVDSKDEPQCYKNLAKYISKYDRDTDAMKGKTGEERAKAVVTNGLLTFRMIHRMVANLGKEMDENCGQSVREAVANIFANSGLPRPSEKDLKDALLGVLRIHFIYGFNATSQMRFGIFGKVNTGVNLDFDDCLRLAQKTFDMKAYALAYQWLLAAAASTGEHNLSEEDNNALKFAWRRLMVLSDTETMSSLHRKYLGKRQETMKDTSANYKLYAACREEVPPSNKTCVYFGGDWNPYFYLAPQKIEILSVEPGVLQFHDVFTNEDIEYFKHSGNNIIVRTGVSNSKEEDPSHGDFISSIDFMLKEEHFESVEKKPKILRKLNNKIEMVTGLRVQNPKSSQTQMVMYGALGGHYDVHHDSMLGADISDTGDRIATFFISLDDVELGGYTAFPYLGVFGRQLKGSALFWFNLGHDLKPFHKARHTGCPVILGTKHAVRRGILEYENMWNYKCTRRAKTHFLFSKG